MKTKKKQKQEVYSEPQKAPSPTIPNDVLKVFLDRNLTVADAVNITQVKDSFLWQKGDIERYRVNVWMKRAVEGQYYNDNYIGYSWFLHFNRKSQTLTDKTTGQVEEDEKSSKKLNGIANGDVRVGKSFR